MPPRHGPDHKKCQHEMPRSPRHPTGDLPCGAPAKHRANQSGKGTANSQESDWINVCGVHARYWRNRGAVVIPIITIHPSVES